jgi:hypothetical protein
MDERAKALIDWVLGPGKRGDLGDFVGGVAGTLVALGVPVHRAGALLDTLHPRFIGMQKIWEPGGDTKEGRATFDHPEIVSGLVRYTIDDAQETGRWFDLRLGDPRADGYDLLPASRAGGIRAGTALHLGEVAYGNIGAGDRLDFTAIGRDVNLLARLEKMCGTLDEPIAASAEFAAALPVPWRRLGDYAFKGFEGAREVFAPG